MSDSITGYIQAMKTQHALAMSYYMQSMKKTQGRARCGRGHKQALPEIDSNHLEHSAYENPVQSLKGLSLRELHGRLAASSSCGKKKKTVTPMTAGRVPSRESDWDCPIT